MLRELEEENSIHPDGPLKIVDACPVRCIREVKANGTELFLGDIGIDRCRYEGLHGEGIARLVDENMAKKTGDPTIVWSVGGNPHEVKKLRKLTNLDILTDYLAPSHHGQGIMSAAVAAVLKSWAVPRCNAHFIQANAFIGNRASVRVFEKNGFTLQKTIEDCIEVRGERRGLYFLQWRRKDQS